MACAPARSGRPLGGAGGRGAVAPPDPQPPPAATQPRPLGGEPAGAGGPMSSAGRPRSAEHEGTDRSPRASQPGSARRAPSPSRRHCRSTLRRKVARRTVSTVTRRACEERQGLGNGCRACSLGESPPGRLASATRAPGPGRGTGGGALGTGGRCGRGTRGPHASAVPRRQAPRGGLERHRPRREARTGPSLGGRSRGSRRRARRAWCQSQ